MTYENLTTYAKYDPGSQATITSPKIIYNNVSGVEGVDVYKVGVGFLTGDFTQQAELTVNSLASGGYADVLYGSPAAGAGVEIDNYSTPGTLKLGIYFDGGDLSVGLTFGVKYYLTLRRVGSNITFIIRTGSHTGTIIDTLTDTFSLNNTDFYALTIGPQIGNIVLENIDTNVTLTPRYAQSLTIASGVTWTSAVLKAYITSGTFNLYMSADGGAHWEAVTNNTVHNFTNTGTDARFKIVDATGSGGVITGVEVTLNNTYNVALAFDDGHIPSTSYLSLI